MLTGYTTPRTVSADLFQRAIAATFAAAAACLPALVQAQDAATAPAEETLAVPTDPALAQADSAPPAATTVESDTATAAAPADAADGADGVDEIVVIGIRSSQARGLSEQRESDNLKNVIAADEVGRFPDLNLGDALGRVSGISVERDQGEARFVNVRGAPQAFTNVGIDGVTIPSPTSGTRSTRMDTIPSDIVSTLEVTKAITPDLDADNIGGYVNVVTHSAFDQPGRVVRANTSYGFNELGGGEIYNLSLTYGDRFLENRNLGVLFSVSDYSTDRHTSNIETNAWSRIDDSSLFRPVRADTRTYELVRARSSYSARVDYEPTPVTRLRLSAVYSDWSDDEKRDNYRLPFPSAGYREGSGFPAGVVDGVNVDSNHNVRTDVNTIQSFTLGGEHDFGRMLLDGLVSVGTAVAEREVPNTYFNFRIKPDRRPTVAYDYSDPDLPDFQRLDGNGTMLIPPEDYDLLNFQMQGDKTEDDEFTVAVNNTIQMDFGSLPGSIKFGAKFRGKEKKRNSATLIWTADDIPFVVDMRDLISSDLALNFDRYPWGYKTSRSNVQAVANRIVASGPGTNSASVSGGNFYRVTEDILAVYGQATVDINRLRILGGVRVERTENDGTANQTSDGWATFETVTASNDYTKVFPSVHLKYELSDNQIVKAAFSTALARADFSALRPSETVNLDEQTISAGNIDIEPTTSRGVDAYYEYYLRQGGLLSAGVFFKQIDDPIFTSTSRTTRDGADFEITRAENGTDGELYGFEINWEQSLTFLPSPFDGLGFFSNFTYSESEATLPFDQGKVSLQGASDRTYNFAVFYERDAFNARLSYLYRSPWLDAFDLSTPELTRFWDERPQLDFTATAPLNRWTQIYLQANNLTDERGRRYLGDLSRVYELEGFGISYMVGAKFNF